MTQEALVRAVDAFARKTASCAFTVGLLRATGVTAAAAAAGLLVARAFDGYLAPSPWWGLAAVPPVAFAIWHARRQSLGRAAAAAHLDRRLGLDGLLLATLECERPQAEWAQRAAAGLQRQATVAPRVQWRPLLPPAVLGLALLSGAAMLPPPDVPLPSTVPTAVQLQVDRLGEKLRELQQALPDDVRDDLEQKVQELARRLDAGEIPEWSEIDRLQEAIEREQLLQLAQERAAAGAARDLNDLGKQGAPTPQDLATAAKALHAAGLLDQLPEAAQKLLAGALQADGTLDPSQLPQDLAALRELADAMAAAAGKFDALPQGLDAGQLADLQQLLQQRGVNPPGEHVHGPECAGGT